MHEREKEKSVRGAICQSAAALELNRDLGEVLTPRCLNITIMMINVNGLFKRSFSEGQLTFIGYKVFCDIHTSKYGVQRAGDLIYVRK